MLHEFECKKCGAIYEAYCFEHLNYTEEGNKTRGRQKAAGLCIPCFGEVSELKKQQTPIPCFNVNKMEIGFRDSTTLGTTEATTEATRLANANYVPRFTKVEKLPPYDEETERELDQLHNLDGWGS